MLELVIVSNSSDFKWFLKSFFFRLFDIVTINVMYIERKL